MLTELLFYSAVKYRVQMPNGLLSGFLDTTYDAIMQPSRYFTRRLHSDNITLGRRTLRYHTASHMHYADRDFKKKVFSMVALKPPIYPCCSSMTICNLYNIKVFRSQTRLVDIIALETGFGLPFFRTRYYSLCDTHKAPPIN